MRPKYLPLATFAYNMFNTPNLGNHIPYELIFGRNPRFLLSLDSNPDIKVSGPFKKYYELLNERLKYLYDLLKFKSTRLAMINKDRTFFQYNSEYLVYIKILPFTSQLCTALQKITIRYVFPVVIYKIIDLHNYLLMILRGLFKHERLKPANIRTNHGNIQNLPQLKHIMNAGLKFQYTLKHLTLKFKFIFIE